MGAGTSGAGRMDPPEVRRVTKSFATAGAKLDAIWTLSGSLTAGQFSLLLIEDDILLYTLSNGMFKQNGTCLRLMLSQLLDLCVLSFVA